MKNFDGLTLEFLMNILTNLKSSKNADNLSSNHVDVKKNHVPKKKFLKFKK